MVGNYLFSLKLWINQSNANYNFVIGIGLVLFFVSSLILVVLIRHSKTNFQNHISAEFMGAMFISSIIWDMYLSSFFSWQINFLLKYSLVLLVGAIFLVIRPLWKNSQKG